MTTPILTCDEVRACEARAVEAGASIAQLMTKAGRTCAEALHGRFPQGRVVVLAGPGNNGGDAFVAAMRFAELGRRVAVFELASGPRGVEADNASKSWVGARHPLEDMRIQPGDVVLDGLFGAGLSRALAGEAAFAVEQINASGATVVAIDVPSGVMGDTGDVAGAALRANVTVTFGAKKPAHVLQPAASLCGDVVVVDVGFSSFVEEVGGGRLLENAPALWAGALRWPDAMTHKHARGRLAVVSGGVPHTGAARLAAYAGLRVGAGVVTVLAPPAALAVAAGAVTAVMVVAVGNAVEAVGATERAAVVIGPAAGVNSFTRANVEALGRAGRAMVVDADALSVFAGEVHALRDVLRGPAVLTPHVGEFERVFPGALRAGRIAAARAAADAAGAVVLLKGYDTVIAAPGARAVVNTHASAFLATAGSGDVLAGVVGGLMAQGVPAFEAACAGAWMHGDAALRAGAGLTAEDLHASLRETLKALYQSRPQGSSRGV
jgi:ADP-dependent NAD(P)H-hydrate dehydratase / NAD(P)H-hydrate epimerase